MKICIRLCNLRVWVCVVCVVWCVCVVCVCVLVGAFVSYETLRTHARTLCFFFYGATTLIQSWPSRQYPSI